MGETWKRIPGHRGYEASSLGRVRSVRRTLADGRQAGGVILQPTPDKDGYERVSVGGRRLSVHRAVALAFHGPPEVRHLNGDETDNSPSNLRWGSHRENERDKKRTGRKKEEGRKEDRSRPSEVETPLRTSRTPPVRLSEAVSQGYVSGSLDAVRKASQRDPQFPLPVAMDGLAALYDAAQLLDWDEHR